MHVLFLSWIVSTVPEFCMELDISGLQTLPSCRPAVKGSTFLELSSWCNFRTQHLDITTMKSLSATLKVVGKYWTGDKTRKVHGKRCMWDQNMKIQQMATKYDNNQTKIKWLSYRYKPTLSESASYQVEHSNSIVAKESKSMNLWWSRGKQHSQSTAGSNFYLRICSGGCMMGNTYYASVNGSSLWLQSMAKERNWVSKGRKKRKQSTCVKGTSASITFRAVEGQSLPKICSCLHVQQILCHAVTGGSPCLQSNNKRRNQEQTTV